MVAQRTWRRRQVVIGVAVVWLAVVACNAGTSKQQPSKTPAKEPALSTSNPPSPPPPPPPLDTAVSAPQDVSRYQSYLANRGIQGGELHEEERLRIGSWRFYYRGAPTAKSDQTAIDDKGNAVHRKDREYWNALLVEPKLDAASAHKRVVWLLGHAAPVDPNYSFKDSAIQQRVTAPELDISPAGDATFVGWVVYPPQMQVPYRILISAPKDAPATVENTLWSKISP